MTVRERTPRHNYLIMPAQRRHIFYLSTVFFAIGKEYSLPVYLKG
ncbi:hypothetical protein ETAE_0844 [Edwardsiella piscicida]|uniref:Uncharacterized protein n=1 Tax=Edwardsiella piscicida TaxID=1263550 RepID=A0AAU8PKI0_EDWPI|nr:hypothetical protein ETAE_0844 [Edwardsiella tarda EIB202]